MLKHSLNMLKWIRRLEQLTENIGNNDFIHFKVKQHFHITVRKVRKPQPFREEVLTHPPVHFLASYQILVMVWRFNGVTQTVGITRYTSVIHTRRSVKLIGLLLSHKLAVIPHLIDHG